MFSHSPVYWQTSYGDIEFGFYPDVAPKTVAHIMKLVRLGAYNTNHFFRVRAHFHPKRMKLSYFCREFHCSEDGGGAAIGFA